MKIYTKTGDSGTTSLIGGERVAKDDCRVEAYGTIDELTAFLAYLRDNMDPEEAFLTEYREDLERILFILMNIAAILAQGRNSSSKSLFIADEDVSYLEGRIDYIETQLSPINSFTIPGGHPLVSLSHICRTICRRAERETIRTAKEFMVEPNVAIYLNRLSDYLYQLGRKLSDEFNATEQYWHPE